MALWTTNWASTLPPTSTILPPLIDTPNIEWLGLLPPEINSFVLFTAGLSTTAKEPEAGRALLRFLTSPEAMAVYKTKGLDPPP